MFQEYHYFFLFYHFCLMFLFISKFGLLIFQLNKKKKFLHVKIYHFVINLAKIFCILLQLASLNITYILIEKCKNFNIFFNLIIWDSPLHLNYYNDYEHLFFIFTQILIFYFTLNNTFFSYSLIFLFFKFELVFLL